MSVYCVGLVLVLLNQGGIGDHGFDRKSLDCIWDRMATYPYTVVYSVTLVWIPSIVIGICYLRLYFFVKAHKKKMHNYNNRNTTVNSGSGMPPRPKLQLAKTFILIYAVFVTCWAPYALLIVIDHRDEFLHEIHVFLTVWAHMHPSLNWLIYYFTQPKFAAAYRKILACGSKSMSPHRPSPKSQENSSDPKPDENNQSPVFQVPLAERELCGTSENHYMEWKPIEKSNSSLSLVTKDKVNDNNNGNGIYRKLYQEIRNIQSEGEVQIFVRGCSLKTDDHTNLRGSRSADLTELDEIDREKFRSSARKRRFGLTDGVKELSEHSNTILSLIDRVCDSQDIMASSPFNDGSDTMGNACEDTFDLKSEKVSSESIKVIDIDMCKRSKEAITYGGVEKIPTIKQVFGNAKIASDIGQKGDEVLSIDDIKLSSKSGETIIETAHVALSTDKSSASDPYVVDSAAFEIVQETDTSEKI